MNNNGFDHTAIADELERTASGEKYYGSALYVARDLPCLTEDDRLELNRWLLQDREASKDRLHQIATCIREKGSS